MKQKLLTFIISLAITIQAGAQERTVENRPYTDLRPFHFGVLVGTHFQLRIAPAMYFGTRHLSFYNMLEKDGAGNPIQQKQEMKTAYISNALDLIFAAQRFNNHRPYIMVGINPMMNLNSKNEDYIKLKKTDLFLELGLGCDFYLPYFKLRPELKFMYGITDTYDKNHIKNIKDKSTLPYTLSAKSAHSKMIALTFYFE